MFIIISLALFSITAEESLVLADEGFIASHTLDTPADGTAVEASSDKGGKSAAKSKSVFAAGLDDHLTLQSSTDCDWTRGVLAEAALGSWARA